MKQALWLFPKSFQPKNEARVIEKIGEGIIAGIGEEEEKLFDQQPFHQLRKTPTNLQNQISFSKKYL